MAYKFMFIPNDDKKITPLVVLQLVVETFEQSTFEPTNQNSIKVFKAVFKKNLL